MERGLFKTMLYLAANNSRVHRLRAAGYPMGWMMSPAGWRNPRELPFALDNGLYHRPGEWPKGMRALPAFYRMLDRPGADAAMFVVVPDVPYDGARSLALSVKHARHVRDHTDAPMALAVQDGMEPSALDAGPWAWVFVAGSTAWKWATVGLWTAEARARGMRVHVARVNTKRRVRYCIDFGVDSADGTGIFRGDRIQLAGVLEALTERPLFAPCEAPGPMV